MPNRALVLRREPLADLGEADLVLVVGGAVTTTCPTWKPLDCVVLPTRTESFCTGSCVYPEA